MLIFKTKNVFRVLWILAPITVIASCASHDLGPVGTVSCEGFKTVSYLNDIKPITANHCALSGCHDGSLGDDRNWTIPQRFKDHASEARRRIQLPITDGDHMPRVGAITFEQIQLIVCWAEQGAPIDN
jgi:hypothetical protein